MATTYIYYIDGEEVTPTRALHFYRIAYRQAVVSGYTDEHDEIAIWRGKDNEEGRELIHNITAIHELGGLEIVCEED